MDCDLKRLDAHDSRVWICSRCEVPWVDVTDIGQPIRRNCPGQTPQAGSRQPPRVPPRSELTLAAKLHHFTIAVWRWARAGFPCRTRAQAARCREVCLACPSGLYDADRDVCRVCGCTVAVRWLPLRSKARMRTEDCPKGHWPR